MKVIDTLTIDEYNDFFNKSKYNHFLQTSDWGEACKINGLKPIYLGFIDDNNKLKAACMAFKKNMPFKLCYLYSPRGILIDYNNKELLKECAEALRKYLKANNSIYFRMDPAIIYQEIDIEANPIENGFNNKELFNYLIKLGFKHKGFNKLFEANQPRYTFRIDTTKPIEEIEPLMNKSYLKTVKRSYNYDLEITNEYDNDTFYNLMKCIAKKDGFNGHTIEFYDELNKLFQNNNHITYITIKMNINKLLSKLENEKRIIDEDIASGKISQKRMADTNEKKIKLEKDIAALLPYKTKKDDSITILTLVCPIIENKMWTLYIGNNDLAMNTFAVNRSYYEAIKYASEHKFEFLDLFGACGDPHTKNKNYQGVYEFKRKMGGTYTEFMGEFDLINKPFIYKLLPLITKVYRKIKKH